jgi:uncharacterized integral membrane protein
MTRLKVILVMLIAVLVVTIFVQNGQEIEFRFLVWRYRVPQLALAITVFALGFLMGFVAAKWPKGRKKDEPEPRFPR